MHFDIESLWLTEKPWADITGHAMRAVFFALSTVGFHMTSLKFQLQNY